MILDGDVTADGLRGYRVLIISNMACISQAQCEAIRAFVAAGGTLIASFETSLYDEDGDKRDDFALAEIFGVRYVGMMRGPLSVRWAERTPWTAQPGTDRMWQVKVEALEGTDVLGEATNGKDTGPYAVLHRTGKGRALYLAGVPGARVFTRRGGHIYRETQYRDHQDPTFRQWALQVLRWADPAPAIQITAARGVFVNVLRQRFRGREGLAVHAVNATSLLRLRAGDRIHAKPEMTWTTLDEQVQIGSDQIAFADTAFGFSPDLNEARRVSVRGGRLTVPSLKRYAVAFIPTEG